MKKTINQIRSSVWSMLCAINGRSQRQGTLHNWEPQTQNSNTESVSNFGNQVQKLSVPESFPVNKKHRHSNG